MSRYDKFIEDITKEYSQSIMQEDGTVHPELTPTQLEQFMNRTNFLTLKLASFIGEYEGNQITLEDLQNDFKQIIYTRYDHLRQK
jgi:hypothetical protein